MRRRAVLGLALLALAGCGGGQVAFTEVKSAPPTLPIPHDQGTAASADSSTTRDANGVTKHKTGGPTGSSGTSTSTTTTTTAPSTAAAAPAATTAPSTGTQGSTGGATPNTPTTTTPSSPSSSNGGASADGLDQFCADNPGACNG